MSKRELIDTGTDKRCVRRDKEGKFKERVDVSRSLPAMTQSLARTTMATASNDGSAGETRYL
ncbi:hypothetical protein [Rhizobium lusitanum]|uniref:hypothetical protein n=1 Tax=Rhizobium lusitanum TaxID=293958 RepID=UPI0013D9F2EA|nr:hypothetical protein [Rhizobium lusitanum]